MDRFRAHEIASDVPCLQPARAALRPQPRKEQEPAMGDYASLTTLLLWGTVVVLVGIIVLAFLAY